MQINVGGTELYVEVSGEGSPALVFLHYWGGTHRTWSALASELESSLRLVTYDMRGWGKSGIATTGYSIAALADEAAGLIESLHLDSYFLIGHSMGGKVAQLVASRKPAGLLGLILVAPATPPSPSHMPDAAKQQQIHAYDNREAVLQTIGFLTAQPPAPQMSRTVLAVRLWQNSHGPWKG